MHYQEIRIQENLELAKKLFFQRFPNLLETFDSEDVTYFIFSELGDLIIDNKLTNEVLDSIFRFLDELLGLNLEGIENLVVIQVFQKIYINEKIELSILESINSCEQVTTVYNKFKVPYLEQFNDNNV